MKLSRILFVDHTAVMGGAELSLLDLASAYASSSKVLLFSDGPLRKRLEEAQVEVKLVEASAQMLSLKASGGFSALGAVPELWRIASQIRREASGFDVIVANSQKAFITSALASFQGCPPVVWHLRDILTAQHFSSINRRIAVALANRCAAKILVNSQATGDAFAAAGGNPELCHVVYNGFQAEKFDTVLAKDVAQVRDELGIEDAPLVGLFSRLSFWKGQHILLEAVKELPDVQIILVGEALFGEQEYVAELKALASSPQLSGRVHWLGFRNDIPALMKACDVVVHTSTEPEPFGRVIVEGQLAQKPVIAAAAGGALELIKSGHNGYLFSPQNIGELRDLLQLLLSDRQLAATIAQQGYSNAVSNFSLENMLQSFAEGIKPIVASQ